MCDTCSSWEQTNIYIYGSSIIIYIICSKELYMSHKKEARVTVSEEKYVQNGRG